MGHGAWSAADWKRYASANISGKKVNDIYSATQIDKKYDPRLIRVRESCDSADHPVTTPIIIGLDVTGSMSDLLDVTAKRLGEMVKDIIERQPVEGPQIMFCAVGDSRCDRSPLQVTQFESDIRIASQLTELWFERGGGGNSFESYTAAWYMGLRHTALDCWKRGRKGIIITLGDEPLNPYLPGSRLEQLTGDCLQGDVETRELYLRALEKFEIFHVAIDDPGDCYRRYAGQIRHSFGRLLKKRLRVSTLDELPRTILECLEECGISEMPRGDDIPDGSTEAGRKPGGFFGLFSGMGTASW